MPKSVYVMFWTSSIWKLPSSNLVSQIKKGYLDKGKCGVRAACFVYVLLIIAEAMLSKFHTERFNIYKQFKNMLSKLCDSLTMYYFI